MINFDNTAPVKLKGAGGGFWITIDPSHPEGELISQISDLIKNLKHLAVNADVTLDVGDARGHDDLIRRIKTHLEKHFDLGQILTSPKNGPFPQNGSASGICPRDGTTTAVMCSCSGAGSVPARRSMPENIWSSQGM